MIHHNRIAAHVDRVSPLHPRSQDGSRYSLGRAVAHNLAGMTQDFGRLVRGRQGDHRTELACRWEMDCTSGRPPVRALLDPSLSTWSLHLEARVSGRIDAARLRRAVKQVLGSRPADHDVLRVLDCPGDSDVARARTELLEAPVSVSDWPPFRAWLTHHHDGDVIMLNANHSACDGPAALQVLHSIAEAYRGDANADTLPDFLATRDLPVHPAGLRAPWLAPSQSVLEKIRDLLARHTHVEADPANDDAGYGFHLFSLSTADTARVIDDQRPGRSRNILLAALHLAIADWNLRHDVSSHRIAVLVQVNLRPPEWRAQTVGNFSVTARVSTSRRHRATPASALAAVTAQTTRNKRTRSGIALIKGLDHSNLLPLWAKQSVVVLEPLTRNRLIDSAMLGNLGVLQNAPSFGAAAGDTTDIWYSAPSRASRRLSIGAVTVADKLHLVVRYPRGVFDDSAVRRFAGGYETQLQALAQSLAPSD